jgi:hypothetical protein
MNSGRFWAQISRDRRLDRVEADKPQLIVTVHRLGYRYVG